MSILYPERLEGVEECPVRLAGLALDRLPAAVDRTPGFELGDVLDQDPADVEGFGPPQDQPGRRPVLVVDRPSSPGPAVVRALGARDQQVELAPGHNLAWIDSLDPLADMDRLGVVSAVRLDCPRPVVDGREVEVVAEPPAREPQPVARAAGAAEEVCGPYRAPGRRAGPSAASGGFRRCRHCWLWVCSVVYGCRPGADGRFRPVVVSSGFGFVLQDCRPACGCRRQAPVAQRPAVVADRLVVRPSALRAVVCRERVGGFGLGVLEAGVRRIAAGVVAAESLDVPRFVSDAERVPLERFLLPREVGAPDPVDRSVDGEDVAGACAVPVRSAAVDRCHVEPLMKVAVAHTSGVEFVSSPRGGEQ